MVIGCEGGGRREAGGVLGSKLDSKAVSEAEPMVGSESYPKGDSDSGPGEVTATDSDAGVATERAGGSDSMHTIQGGGAASPGVLGEAGTASSGTGMGGADQQEMCARVRTQ